MDIMELGAIGELVGGVAVIASLIYVGYQVRETRTAMRASAAQARTDLGVSLIATRYSTDIGEILVRSQEDPMSLDSVAKFKLKSFFAAHVRHCQNLFYQRENKLLDDYFNHGIAHVVTYWVRNYPWANEEWAIVKETLPGSFSDFIDNELGDHLDIYRA